MVCRTLTVIKGADITVSDYYIFALDNSGYSDPNACEVDIDDYAYVKAAAVFQNNGDRVGTASVTVRVSKPDGSTQDFTLTGTVAPGDSLAVFSPDPGMPIQKGTWSISLA